MYTYRPLLLLCLFVVAVTFSACGEDDAEETPSPEASEPETAEPEAEEPEAGEPETAEPEMAEPEMAEPEMAEPDVMMGDALLEAGEWTIGLQFADIGSVSLALRATIEETSPGRIGAVRLRIQDEDGQLSDELARDENIIIDSEDGFVLEFENVVVPAEFSPLNNQLTVSFQMMGQLQEDDFFCGTATGSVEQPVQLELTMGTFGASPQEAGQAPTSCDWTPIDEPLRATIGPEERTALALLPQNHNPDMSWPVVMVLHGFGASGTVQADYFGLTERVNREEFVLLVPEGTQNQEGSQFWNATERCCAPEGSQVDDVAYLLSLIDETVVTLGGDPNRVYLVGHSNGGFMSHRMVCDAGDRIAGILSLAGSTLADDANCTGSSQVAVLNVHGTQDESVFYEGVSLDENGPVYPGALETTQRWAARNMCDEMPTEQPRRDYVTTLDGEETTKMSWTGCADNASVELWTVEDGEHIPGFNDLFVDDYLAFLFRHARGN